MTIAYNIFDIKILFCLSLRRCYNISENSIIFISFSVYLLSIATHLLINFTFETKLSILYSIKRYNQYMNNSNKNV